MVKHLDERVVSLSERVKNVQKTTNRFYYNDNAMANMVEALNDVSSSCTQILRSMGHDVRPARNTEISASSPPVFRTSSQ
ncbi:hypothetical protein BGZ54_005295, partial [Gamsiella multidivaricata]